MIRVRLFALLIGFSIASAGFAADSIRIELAAQRQLPNQVIRLSDVAALTGGDLISRRKIADLDIAILKADDDKTVSRRQIELRIMLAGFTPEQFRLDGANSVRIKRMTIERRVLEFLKPEISKRMGLPAADLQIQLTRPISQRDAAQFVDDVVLQHNLSSQVRIGAFSTVLTLTKSGKPIHSLTLNLDVQVYRDVFVAKHVLEAGTMLSAKDFTRQRRFIDGRTRRNLPESIEGRQVRKLIPAGEVITHLDLARKKSIRVKREIAIRSRDIVEVIAVGSRLQASINGAVALQSGAVGEAIRVKNPRSGKVLAAEVVSPGVAKIRL